jgi:hypothetical protein
MASLAIPLALSGISALSGLFANRAKKQQEESTTTQTKNIDQLNAPEYDPKTGAMRDILMNYYLDRLGGSDDFFSKYRSQGLSDINRGSDAASQNIQNILANRGTSGTSAGVSSQIQGQLNRIMQQNQFLNQIPLMQDQRMSGLLGEASGFFKGLPVGQRTTGTDTSTSTTKGTVTQPGNMLGGAIGGLASSLGSLYGQGAFEKYPQYGGIAAPKSAYNTPVFKPFYQS